MSRPRILTFVQSSPKVWLSAPARKNPFPSGHVQPEFKISQTVAGFNTGVKLPDPKQPDQYLSGGYHSTGHDVSETFEIAQHTCAVTNIAALTAEILAERRAAARAERKANTPKSPAPAPEAEAVVAPVEAKPKRQRKASKAIGSEGAPAVTDTTSDIPADIPAVHIVAGPVQEMQQAA